MEPQKDPNEEINQILADFQQSRSRRSAEAPVAADLEPPMPAHAKAPKSNESNAEKQEKAPENKKEKAHQRAGAKKSEKKPKKNWTAKQKCRFWMILACVAAAIVLALTVPAIQDRNENAYLKSYEDKYGISYPAGMLEQYCDAYGKDRQLAGFLSYGGKQAIAVSKKEAENRPYLDKGSDASHFGFQTVIYGDTKQLPDLEQAYGSAAACNQSGTTLTYDSLFETGTWQVVGALYINTDPQDDNGYCFPYNVTGNMTPDSYKQFYARLCNRLIYTSSRTLTRNDHLLSLSTESTVHPGWRFVLVAAKDGEQRDVRDVQTPQYPQAYFDSESIKNPYAPFNHWYPEIYKSGAEKPSRQNAKDYPVTPLPKMQKESTAPPAQENA